MEIKGRWSASSKTENSKDNSLRNLIGQWGIKIKVEIDNPYSYSKDQIE